MSHGYGRLTIHDTHMKNPEISRRHWPVFMAFALALTLVSLPLTLRAEGALTVEQPHVRITIPGRPAAGYMTVKNAGTKAEAIVSASSPLARRVELHEHSMNGGIMRMRQVEKVDVPAAGKVEFSSGGYHLMIFGLDKDVKPGDMLPVTLTMKSGKNIDMTFPVGKIGETPGKSNAGHSGHSHHKH